MTSITRTPPPHPVDSGEVTEALDATGKLSKPPPLPPRPASSLPPPPESVSRVRSKTTPPPLPPQAKRAAPRLTAPATSQRRFRVSIKPSLLDPTLLVVRRLEEGMALPPGTSEGWLETSALTNVEEPPGDGKSVR